MKSVYFAIAFLGALYFLLKKRRFDYLTIGYFSALVYFLPALYGKAMSQYGPGDPILAPLATETYFVMVSVILAILIGAVVYDAVPHRKHRHVGLAGTVSAGNFALLLGVASCVLSLVTIGPATLMAIDKNLLLASFNRWLILWELCSAFAVVFFFSRRQWFRFAIAALLVLGDVFIGFRVTFAFAFIACFTLWAEEQGMQRFGIRQLRPILVAVSLIAFLFLYKTVYMPIKAGMWDIVLYQLMSPEAVNQTITTSEPFVTQSILNQVVISSFHVPFDHFGSTLYQFAFFAPSLGAKTMTFNDYFQPVLFPTIVDMGLANNIWAEMWSAGGWPLLLLFIALDVVLLCCFSMVMRIDNLEVRAAIALPAVAWAFYLHRNDLFVETNIIKRLLLVGVLCIVMAMLAHDATHRLRRRVRTHVKRVAERRRRAGRALAEVPRA